LPAQGLAAQGFSLPAQGLAAAQGFSSPAQGLAAAQGFSLPAQGLVAAQGFSLPAQGLAAQGLSATIVDTLPSSVPAKEVLGKVAAPAIVKIEAAAKVAM